MGVDEKKIAIITCVNDESLYQEAMLYIRHLEIPAGMTVEILEVWEAKSMTAGYQYAMENSDAKYKIYIHQDCFLCNKNILQDLVNIFLQDSSIGVIGVAGAGDLSVEKPVWWCSRQQYGTIYTKQGYEHMHQDRFGEVAEPYVEAAVVDGVFMATQYDLPWRQELFDGWHFYDVSQSREFINAGYKVVIPYQEKPWVIHFSPRKTTFDGYNKYSKIFLQEYFY